MSRGGGGEGVKKLKNKNLRTKRTYRKVAVKFYYACNNSPFSFFHFISLYLLFIFSFFFFFFSSLSHSPAACKTVSGTSTSGRVSSFFVFCCFYPCTAAEERSVSLDTRWCAREPTRFISGFQRAATLARACFATRENRTRRHRRNVLFPRQIDSCKRR